MNQKQDYFSKWKSMPYWVVCDRRNPDGRNFKAPINPATLRNASAKDPATWTTYSKAKQTAPAYGGVLGLFPVAPLVCIDLDDCLTGGKVKTETARKILAAMYKTGKTYTSVSQSGRGLHVWCLAHINRSMKATAQDGQCVEVYQTRITEDGKTAVRGHYIAETFKTATAAPLEWKTAEVLRILDEYDPPRPKETPSAADLGDLLEESTEWEPLTEAEQREEIRSALKAIDPAPLSYDEWLNIGKALESTGLPDAAEIWDEWSQRDPARYKAGECAYKFGTFHKEGVTARTIYQLAYETGWKSPVQHRPRSQSPAEDFGEPEMSGITGTQPVAEPAGSGPDPAGSDPIQADPVNQDAAQGNSKPAEMTAGEKKERRLEIYRGSSLLAHHDELWNHFEKYEPRVSTGLLDLDIILHGGLFPELYILGAEPGKGKSAFSQALAEDVAARGTDVIYFALEMGRDEITARGISRTTYREWTHARRTENPVPFSDILYYQYSEITGVFSKVRPALYRNAYELYTSECGPHFHVFENTKDGMTARNVFTIVSEMIDAGIVYRPLVVVDYLQILAPDKDDRAQVDRKTKTDIAVRYLKTLSEQYHIPIWVITAMNRDSYDKRVQLSSARESSDIEYTAGVFMGLNDDLEELPKPKANSGSAVKQLYSQAMDDARDQPTRYVSVDLLKNRNAPNHKRLYLDYVAPYNYFRAVTKAERREELDAIRRKYDPDITEITDSKTEPAQPGGRKSVDMRKKGGSVETPTLWEEAEETEQKDR